MFQTITKVEDGASEPHRLEDLVYRTYRGLAEDPAQLAWIRDELDGEGTCYFEGSLTAGGPQTIRVEIQEIEKGIVRSESTRNKKYALKGEMLYETLIEKLAKSDLILGLANGVMHLGTPR